MFFFILNYKRPFCLSVSMPHVSNVCRDSPKYIYIYREFLVATEEGETDPDMAEAVTCLAFEPTMPSKFMVGTRRGRVVSCRMAPKQGSSNMILGVFDDMTKSRIMSVDRNPFYPKNFLVIRYLQQCCHKVFEILE